MAEAASGSQDKSVQVKLVLLGGHFFLPLPRFSAPYLNANLNPL